LDRIWTDNWQAEPTLPMVVGRCVFLPFVRRRDVARAITTGKRSIFDRTLLHELHLQSALRGPGGRRGAITFAIRTQATQQRMDQESSWTLGNTRPHQCKRGWLWPRFHTQRCLCIEQRRGDRLPEDFLAVARSVCVISFNTRSQLPLQHRKTQEV